MEKEGLRKIKLGIFVITGIAFFIVAIYFLGKHQNYFGRNILISCIFKEVNGLQVGNNVRFSGINVGTVKSINIISDTTIMVDIVIEEDVRKYIKKDAIAYIGTEGLMGNKIIAISPGTPENPMVEEGDVLGTGEPLDIDEVLGSLKITTENAENITENLAEIIIKVNKGNGTIGMLLNDTTTSEEIKQSLQNIKSGTKTISNVINSIKLTSENSERISQDLSEITNKINEGKGTIGKLINDTGLAEQIEETVYNLEAGSREFSENMQAFRGSWLLRRYFRPKKNKEGPSREKEKEKVRRGDGEVTEN